MAQKLGQIKEIRRRNEESYTLVFEQEKAGPEIDGYLLETMKMAQAIDDTEGYYKALIIRSTNAYTLGDYAQLEAFLNIISEETLKKDCSDFCQMIYYSMRMIYYLHYKGDEKESFRYAKLELAAAEAHGDQKEIMRIRMNMAITAAEIGYLETSKDLLDMVIEYFESTGTERNLAYCYVNIGSISKKMGRWQEAEKNFRKSLKLSVKHHFKALEHTARTCLGEMYRKLGEYEKALEELEKAKLVEEPLNQKRQTFKRVHESVRLLMVQNRHQEAYEEMTAYEPKLEAMENIVTKVRFYKDKADLCGVLRYYEEGYKALNLYTNLKGKEDKKEQEQEMERSIHKTYREEANRLDALAEIGRSLTTLKDLDDMLLKLIEEFQHILSMASIGIGIVDGEQLKFDHYFDHGVKYPPVATTLNSDVSMSVWCARNKKQIVINNLQQEAKKYVRRVGTLPETSETQIQSAIFGPMVVNGHMIGVFTVQSEKKYAYTSREVKLFTILTDYIAVAVDNALQKKKLEELSIRDNLTGLYNRRGFSEHYGKQIYGRRASLTSVAILMLDLDHFKSINDTYGHSVGDTVLRSVAMTLSGFESDNIIAVRLGGEEFALVFSDCQEEAVIHTAETIRRKLEGMTIEVEGHEITVTTSMGLVWYDGNIEGDYNKLYFQADSALYRAKELGRNRLEIYRDAN